MTKAARRSCLLKKKKKNLEASKRFVCDVVDGDDDGDGWANVTTNSALLVFPLLSSSLLFSPLAITAITAVTALLVLLALIVLSVTIAPFVPSLASIAIRDVIVTALPLRRRSLWATAASASGLPAARGLTTADRARGQTPSRSRTFRGSRALGFRGS